MKYCPITYEVISHHQRFSERGLRLLSPQLKTLNPLQFTSAELNSEALMRVGKMSIQGVQPKLSARLQSKDEKFLIVDSNGRYILKPQNIQYAELPENEAITMTLASHIGLDVPVHGLIDGIDNKMTYFIKRFDRIGHAGKVAVEDFAQLSGLSRDTKYNASMESVIKVIEHYCTFPKIEFVKLFKLTIFNFLIGNEDMHLKNFSLITKNNIISLSPCYDLLNTTIALPYAEEEIALSLNGKKSNLKRTDLLDYFAKNKLKLNTQTIDETLNAFQLAIPIWKQLLEKSFLSKKMQDNYMALLNLRCEKLKI